MKKWQHFTITLATSLSVSAAGSEVAEKVIPNAELDLTRMGIALITGTIVQAFTLAFNGKGFERLDKARSRKALLRARSTNAAEAALAGIASAAAVGTARGLLGLELPLSGEFTVAAIVGSLGAEQAFKRLEKINPIFKGEEKEKDKEKTGDDT